MKKLILISLTILSQNIFSQVWDITNEGVLPEKVSNNAVCEGYQNDTLFIYSFCGIDSTLNHEGIHLKSFRFNTITKVSEQIADVPDSLGKIGVAANRIGDTIYVTGGYHVLQDGSEITSNKVHRFNTQSNTWLSDGAEIPVATDDHVQAVYKDSLLFLVTGWRNTTNIRNTQIYNPNTNQWQAGTFVPGMDAYKAFGASGTIIGDTIYYFGGASSQNFGSQNFLRKGYIDPVSPTNISWSISIPDSSIFGYRMAATSVNQTPHWIGGSSISYNYDGLAYFTGNIVNPSNRDIFLNSNDEWAENIYDSIPMDLRGIGNAQDSVKYILGGMFNNQVVSNIVYKLKLSPTLQVVEEYFKSKSSIFFSPNPFKERLILTAKAKKNYVKIQDMQGKVCFRGKDVSEINTNHFQNGMYILKMKFEGNLIQQKLIKQ